MTSQKPLSCLQLPAVPQSLNCVDMKHLKDLSFSSGTQQNRSCQRSTSEDPHSWCALNMTCDAFSMTGAEMVLGLKRSASIWIELWQQHKQQQQQIQQHYFAVPGAVRPAVSSEQTNKDGLKEQNLHVKPTRVGDNKIPLTYNMKLRLHAPQSPLPPPGNPNQKGSGGARWVTWWHAAACCCLVSWRRAVACAAAMRRMDVMLAAFLASMPSFSLFCSKMSARC